MPAAPLTPDRPQFEPEVGEFSRDMDREAARGLHLLPMGAVAVELEIRAAGIEGYLPRRDRQGPHRDTRDRHVDQIADLLDRPDLDLGGKDRRTVSVGTSACTISTKLAARRIERSMIGPTRTP